MTYFLSWLVWLAFLPFATKRLLTYLHIFQQDEYSARRFMPWIFRTLAFDRKVSAALVILGLLLPTPFAAISFISVLGLAAWWETNPCHIGKKPLILTPRASRILGLAWALVCIGATLAHPLPWWGWVLAVQALPWLLPVANILLKPLEWLTQSHYWREAHAKLLTINPTVIGITGSYGKTSVKYLLGHVLQTHARTYYTPNSINTPMGVSRALRENMPTTTKYYIGEMGAYWLGSIKRLCQLTPPHHGIITALGEAHYERFKTLENVARTKFELAEAVLSKQGKIVVSESVLAQPYALAFVQQHRSAYIVCGMGKDADVRVSKPQQTKNGTRLDVTWEKHTITLEAPLWGHHQVGNIALVFGMAMNLGLTPEQVSVALKTAPQTKHRLEVKPQPNGSMLIDDAYNANPIGFINALDTLTLLCPKGGRRILVTPGMAELGAEHANQHALLGAKALTSVDVALVVKPERIPSFTAALTPLGKNLLTFPTFTSAKRWLDANTTTQDVILLENDLPDLYEKKLSL